MVYLLKVMAIREIRDGKSRSRLSLTRDHVQGWIIQEENGSWNERKVIEQGSSLVILLGSPGVGEGMLSCSLVPRRRQKVAAPCGDRWKVGNGYTRDGKSKGGSTGSHCIHTTSHHFSKAEALVSKSHVDFQRLVGDVSSPRHT